MSLNCVTNPVGQNSIMPQMQPIQPTVPCTIKIDIVPNYPMAQAPYAQPNVIYNMPQTSLYEPKTSDKKDETPKAEVKTPETKKQDKRDVALAQIMAAQAGVKTDKTEDKKEVKQNKPEIVKPDVMKAGIDVESLMTILNSPDYEEQADAMEAMAEVATYAPEKAGELLDNKVIDALNEIMTKDTSSMKGDDKKLAERNKEYAMFTTATLQKLFADEVKQVGNVDVPAKDLVGMEAIVKNLATSPNESVREAAVASIGYIDNPVAKKGVAPLLNAAAQDPSAVVRAQANKQLNKA